MGEELWHKGGEVKGPKGELVDCALDMHARMNRSSPAPTRYCNSTQVLRLSARQGAGVVGLAVLVLEWQSLKLTGHSLGRLARIMW